MSNDTRCTLAKSERVCSRTTVEQLFGGGGSKAMSAFPLRLVYMLADRRADEPQAQMLVSVPKRCFKRAVKRNRVKRQVREAYRHCKHGVADVMLRQHPGKTLVMAFICIDGHLHPTSRIADKVQNLLQRLEEKLGTAPVTAQGQDDSHEG